jgi:tyrosine-protein kinase Etk/Wzc
MSEDSTGRELQAASHKVDEKSSLLDFLIVLAKHKKLVVGTPIVAALLAAVVSLMLPSIYKATTKILPPQQAPSTTTALLAQFGALMGGAAASPLAFRNPNDLYIGMLKSRTVADNLIARFDMQREYGKNTTFDTRKKLSDRTVISSGRDGIITVDFEDTDPKRAAAIANAYAEELYKLTSTLAITEASQRRLFFESQLKQTRDQLSQAETSLREAIDKGGLAGVDVQSRAILEPSAQLRAQIALREVQVSAVRIFATDQHPDIQRLRHEIASMKRELAKLEGGDGTSKNLAANSAGYQNLRRFKDVKFLERLTELLTQQFEAAKIDEAKDTSIVQVLDSAVEPEKRSWPARTRITLTTAFLGLVLGIVLAFVRERIEKARSDPLRALQLTILRQHLRLK